MDEPKFDLTASQVKSPSVVPKARMPMPAMDMSSGATVIQKIAATRKPRALEQFSPYWLMSINPMSR